MPTKNDIQKFRKDSKNYRYRGCLYHCSEDPYLIIPKQIPWMGWTVNFGHPKAVSTLKWLIFWATAPLLFIICKYKKPIIIEFVLVIQIILISIWSHKQATQVLYTEPVRMETDRHMPKIPDPE